MSPPNSPEAQLVCCWLTLLWVLCSITRWFIT